MDNLPDDLPAELQAYTEVRNLAKAGNHQQAIAALETSSINESTKAQLKLALESKEEYVITRIFGELDARLKQAICWECWR